MILSWKRVGWSLQVGEEFLPQVDGNRSSILSSTRVEIKRRRCSVYSHVDVPSPPVTDVYKLWLYNQKKVIMKTVQKSVFHHRVTEFNLRDVRSQVRMSVLPGCLLDAETPS